MRIRTVGASATLVAVAGISSCGADRLDPAGLLSETSLALSLTPSSTPAALPSSPEAHRSIAALRERFRITAGCDGAASGPKPPPRASRKDDGLPVAVVGPGVATSFEPTGAGSVRAVVPPEAKRRVLRAASVELSRRANATSCKGDKDCASPSRCVAGSCISGATCSDTHTAQDSAGHPTSCDRYICSAGACKTTCGSVDDCSSPNVCDTSHHCTAPSSASGESGGCSLAAPPRGGSPSRTAAWFIVLGLAALTARRRRSRRA